MVNLCGYFVRVNDMAKKKICPCFKCEDRHITCHDTCKRYLNWKEEHEAIRDKARKERELNQQITELKEATIKRVRCKK